MPAASVSAASTSAKIARSDRDATIGSLSPSTCTYVRRPSPRSSASSGITANTRSARTNFPYPSATIRAITETVMRACPRVVDSHGISRRPRACASAADHNGRVGAGEFEVTADLADALDQVIAERSIVSLYQPIFYIADQDAPREEYPVVAYEALARAPKGSPVEYPDELF